MPKREQGTSGDRFNKTELEQREAARRAAHRSKADVLAKCDKATPEKLARFLVDMIASGQFVHGDLSKPQTMQNQLCTLDAILEENE